mmetsp:Transcript_1197/g.5068  ORF Transcript_1197/g.5068 Transcript_1197/m.5068 type:complete len:234 (+) Transcript_1197:526-1227(+)
MLQPDRLHVDYFRSLVVLVELLCKLLEDVDVVEHVLVFLLLLGASGEVVARLRHIHNPPGLRLLEVLDLLLVGVVAIDTNHQDSLASWSENANHFVKAGAVLDVYQDPVAHYEIHAVGLKRPRVLRETLKMQSSVVQATLAADLQHRFREVEAVQTGGPHALRGVRELVQEAAEGTGPTAGVQHAHASLVQARLRARPVRQDMQSALLWRVKPRGSSKLASRTTLRKREGAGT